MNSLNVLYEDNHIIVVEKRPNILSQADNTNDLDMLTIIKKYLKDKYKKNGNVFLGLVHRLDRPVGGVMIFAKTSKAASRLSESIRTGQMHKYYYAIVEGVFSKKEDVLEDCLLKTKDKNVIVNSKEGKDAKLKYKVLKEQNNMSLLDIELYTGRYHQIRVQMSSRNHPIYGDQLYGNRNHKQIALFAYKLSFPHPTTKEQLVFSLEPQGDIWNEFLVNKE